MGWWDWEIPDKWTYKPIWLPPYYWPAGITPNLHSQYTKREIKQELGEIPPPPKKYYFFDTPDYADCHKKIYQYTYFGFKLGSAVALIDIVGGRQLSYLTAMGRIAGHLGRFGGSLGIYAATVCCVANLRGKKHDCYDVPMNHMLGGASIGLIWGYKTHSVAYGCIVGAAGALAGVLNLRANYPTPNYPNGWLIFPDESLLDEREENATLGGRNFRDQRLSWKLHDPGRRGLE
ncbi:NADH dehydrogenase [ubiquinone] 1 alpha subcomplex subunit 11-like [Oppia nitens]|uniref:NADH dehydrogenase [ubiquinone] 1 alpha subcomplex subunit 11-like n=1 Tax=Oppia nitens TaxID=1686743 RepID=UPI0023D9B1F2|nr:NADH dehydrogenase [ubiquinone] 1 alpha subcomplex subunit 11-like [Oppia nitens]